MKEYYNRHHNQFAWFENKIMQNLSIIAIDFRISSIKNEKLFPQTSVVNNVQ